MTKQQRRDKESKGTHLQRMKPVTERLLLGELSRFAICQTKRTVNDHFAV
jgi:hypothetical protein